jgi:hypothetical protein
MYAVRGESRRMDVEEIVDRLYALPLEEFTRGRNQAERELRKAGQREQAEQVKALRKPTAAAAAANNLVHAYRAQVEEFLRAAATLRDAQLAGKGDLAAAAQAEREELEKLVRLGGEAVRPTLEAAAVDDNTARDLLEARLVREPEPAGFGTLLAHAGNRTSRPQPENRAGAKQSASKPPATRVRSTRRREAKLARPADGAARRRLQETKQMLTTAAAEERQARRRWTQAQRELEKAQASVERAQTELDRLHAR